MTEKTTASHTGEYEVPTDSDPISLRIATLSTLPSLTASEKETLSRISVQYEEQKDVYVSAFAESNVEAIKTGQDRLRKDAPNYILNQASSTEFDMNAADIAQRTKSVLNIERSNGKAWYTVDKLAEKFENNARNMFMTHAGHNVRDFINAIEPKQLLAEAKESVFTDWQSNIEAILKSIEERGERTADTKKRSLGARAAKLFSGQKHKTEATTASLISTLNVAVTGMGKDDFTGVSMRRVHEYMNAKVRDIVEHERQLVTEQLARGVYQNTAVHLIDLRLREAGIPTTSTDPSSRNNRERHSAKSEQQILMEEMKDKVDALFAEKPNISETQVKTRLSRFHHPDLFPPAKKQMYTELTQFVDSYVQSKLR